MITWEALTAARPVTRPPERAIRLALIEDSPEYALMVHHLLLQELGHDVRIDHCGSMAEAKPVLAEGQVDCILLDLSLPDAAGLEGLHAVHARLPHVPVVVLSGEEEESVALEAMQNGAQDYLVKRFTDSHVLGRAIRYAIERKSSELELAHRATHDALTGLPNRAVFLERLEFTLARIERRECSCAVLFLDLDRFKVVNDSLGHDVGDLLLIQTGERLRALVRPSDTVARFGGDEFVVLCEDLGGPGEAIVVAGRIAEVLGTPFQVGAHELRVGASVGIAMAVDRGRAPDALVRDADQAMYAAKRRGSGWEMFDPDARVPVTARLGLESELRRAIAQQELRLDYQPEFDTGTGAIAGIEALLRWEHPERGLLAPREFLPCAEASGLSVPIGEWVLAEACAQLARLRDENLGGPALTMSVNVSAPELVKGELTANVTRALAETGLDGSQLCLEMPEAALLFDSEAAGENLRSLRGLGVGLALDDFGRGHGSLSLLGRYPFDALKIDRPLAAQIGSGERVDRLYAAAAGLAGTLGLRCVAEGIETEEQLAFAKDAGCDSAQGFLLSRPLEAHRLAELLR